MPLVIDALPRDSRALLADALGCVVPIARAIALNPVAAAHQRAARAAREAAARQARADRTVAYAQRYGVPDTDAAVRALAELYDRERVELFSVLAQGRSGRARLYVAVGEPTEVSFDFDRMRAWLRDCDPVRAWTAHQHLAITPEDWADDTLDAPSPADVRLSRHLERIPVIRDNVIIDARSCGADEPEVRFWSFREQRYCSADRHLLGDAPALAARGRRW